MKKQLLFLIFISFSALFNSQYYNFSKQTSTYTPLTGSTSVNNGSVWNSFDSSVNIGFIFNINGTNAFNFLKFSSDFFPTILFNTHTDTNYGYVFGPVLADIVDRGHGTTVSKSNISYKTEGVSGSRIFKIEWNNAGFLGEITPDNVSSDFASFQLWLYEGSHIIEYHYGPSFIGNPAQSYWGETGVGAGLFPKVNLLDGTIVDNSYILSGDPSNPTLNYNTTETYLVGFPPSGTVYRFTPNTSLAAQNLTKNKVSVFPTLVEKEIFINSDAKIKSVVIYDMQGRQIKNSISQEKIMNVEKLSPGNYIVHIETENSVSDIKITKK